MESEAAATSYRSVGFFQTTDYFQQLGRRQANWPLRRPIFPRPEPFRTALRAWPIIGMLLQGVGDAQDMIQLLIFR